MKKSLCLMAVLLLAAVLVIPTAFYLVNSEKENVVITEEVVFGNPHAADGLTLTWKTHWDGKLLWETAYQFGDKESGRTVSTDFTYGSARERWQMPFDENVSIESFGGWGGSGRFVPEDTPWPRIISAVAERTKAGEERVEKVRFADYYEYYPIELSVGTRDGAHYDYGMDEWMEYFRIPVPEDEWMTVTLEKDAEGHIVEINCDIEGGVGIYCVGAFRGTEVFFTYYCEKYDGGYVHPEGAYGIFYMPIGEFGEDAEPEVVCELAEAAVPVAMEIDGNTLFLVTREQEHFLLNVYELEGNVPVFRQSLELGESREEEQVYWGRFRVADGGVFACWSDSSFVFVEEKDGQYEIFCKDVFPVNGGEPREPFVDNFVERSVICFDGERLALAAYNGKQWVDVDLAVYGRDGMEYYGVYKNSGNIDNYVTPPEGGYITPQGDMWNRAIEETALELTAEYTRTR